MVEAQQDGEGQEERTDLCTAAPGSSAVGGCAVEVGSGSGTRVDLLLSHIIRFLACTCPSEQAASADAREMRVRCRGPERGYRVV